jgi:RNA polymerase sigma factor (sigma-70 family)
MATDDFDEVFRNLFAIAYRVAFRSTGSAAESEEIAQETLTRALTRWGRIKDYAPAWVATVAIRLAIDASRRADRQRAITGTDRPSTVEDHERRMDLYDALRKLPNRQREALACRYLADLPDEETALLLNISTGSVKQHAARGLEALRRDVITPEGLRHA